MAMNTNEVFGLVFLVLFLPVAVPTLIWFYLRQDVQPIKARSPDMVVIADVILITFVVVLCVQRIFDEDYPCWLNVWQQFIGIILLLNVYVIRCWILYFNYNHTQWLLSNNRGFTRLTDHQDDDDSKDVVDEARHDLEQQEQDFFFRYKKFTDMTWLSRAMVVVLIILLIPAIIITAADEDIRTTSGDEDCDKKWADIVLVVYVCVYVAIFSFFAIKMRQVVDGFKIKEELRFTGVICIVGLIPWFLFNTVFEDVNIDTFPFSTLIVLIITCAALIASTGWPLYRSIYKPPNLQFHIPDDISSLESLLGDEKGFQSFKEFLTREFSVENLLFWDDVRQFRAEKAKGINPLNEHQMARNIYSKYIISGASFEVNLPGNIVDDLEKKLKAEYTKSRSHLSVEERKESHAYSSADSLTGAVQTVFDAAEHNIFKLMETDSYQRYITSDLYADLVQHYDLERSKRKALAQMDLLS